MSTSDDDKSGSLAIWEQPGNDGFARTEVIKATGERIATPPIGNLAIYYPSQCAYQGWEAGRLAIVYDRLKFRLVGRRHRMLHVHQSLSHGALVLGRRLVLSNLLQRLLVGVSREMLQMQQYCSHGVHSLALRGVGHSRSDAKEQDDRQNSQTMSHGYLPSVRQVLTIYTRTRRRYQLPRARSRGAQPELRLGAFHSNRFAHEDRRARTAPHAGAPTGKEPPFLIAQLLTLALFVVVGVTALKRFPRRTVEGSAG